MVTRYLRFPGGKSKALTFSYDDGVSEDIRLVEIFRKNGMKATFNINSGMFGPEDRSYLPGRAHRRLCSTEVKELYTEDVCEVACHCVSHAFLSACDPAVACMEIIDDRRNLETMFGRQIHGMAYPNSAFNDAVVDAVRCAGIYYARTVEATLNFNMPKDWLRMGTTCHHKHPKLMELADKFLELKPKYNPQLFYVWGHSYEFNDMDNWHVIEDFAEKMAHKDDIWYATNIEIYYAWLDYQRLESSIDGSIIHNPSVRSVWIADKAGKTYEIKPGETVTL